MTKHKAPEVLINKEGLFIDGQRQDAAVKYAIERNPGTGLTEVTITYAVSKVTVDLAASEGHIL